MQQGLPKREFYDDMVYKLKKNVSKAEFSDQLGKLLYVSIEVKVTNTLQEVCLGNSQH